MGNEDPAVTRRTKAERRLDYLDIGAELVAEGGASATPDPGLALAHVRIAEVAERAGVTKGALYHLWDSQEAYWHDLLEFLLQEDRLTGSSNVPELTSHLNELHDADPTMGEWANFLFDRFKDDPTFFTRISIFAYLLGDDFREELDQEFRQALDKFMVMGQATVDRMGRRVRPGMNMGDFAVAVSALMQGLCLEHRIDPGRTPELEIDGRRLTLFGVATEALLDAFTEVPADTGSSNGPEGQTGTRAD